MNGDAVGENGAGVTLTLDKPGRYQVLLLDEAGQVAAANFTVQ